MVELKLSWPAKELSPNARLHWAKVAKVKKRYRSECYYLAVKHRDHFRDATKLVLEVEFNKPTRRQYDRDNMLARMKSALDGVADGLGVNDRVFDPVIVSVNNEPVKGGNVILRIYEAKK